MRDRTVHAVVLVASIIVGAVFAVVVPSAPAHAQYPGGGAIGGGGGSVFNGGTITSGLTISGVTNDISTPGSEDLTLTAGSGGYSLTGSDGTKALQITTSTGGSWALGKNGSAQGRIQPVSNSIIIGGTSAGTLNTQLACITGSMGTSTAATCTRGTSAVWVDGVGAITGGAAVSGNGNLSSTIACDSTKVRTELWYVDTGTNHTSKCLCEQTGSSTYGWVAASGTGDCT